MTCFTEYKNYMNETRGSEWRKWDLHIHAPGTKLSDGYKTEDATDPLDMFCDKLEGSSVQVFGITDYFSVDSFKQCIKRFREKYPDSKKHFFFNLELRLNETVNRALEEVNLHLIFNPTSLGKTTQYDQIEKFLNHLQVVKTGINETPIMCSELVSEDDFKSATVTRAAIKSAIETTFGAIAIRKDHLLIFTAANNDGLRPERGKRRKEDICDEIDKFSDGFFGGIQNVTYYLSQDRLEAEGTTISKKPVVAGCDAHSFDDIDRFLGNRVEEAISKAQKRIIKDVTWIKADPTFEGLKQIIYEPEYRVKIQKEKPDYKEDRLIIEEVKFISSNNKFSSAPICLNENLNVILGGKSSGKSILLYNIAKTLIADKSFLVKEKIEDKYDFRSEDANFNFEVKTKGGFSQLMYRESDVNSIIPEIKYIPQNYLIKLAEPDKNKTGNALNKIIRELINEDSDSRQVYTNFVSLLKSNDRKREGIIDYYFDIKDKISLLESQLRTKTSKEILESNILTNNSKVEELNKSAGLTKEQIDAYNQLQIRFDQNNIERTKFNNDFIKISEFNKETSEVLKNLANKRNYLIDSLENDILKEYIKQNYSGLDIFIGNLNRFISTTEISRTPGENVNPIASEFLKLEKTENEIKDQLKPFLDNEEVKKQIGLILESISEDKTSLQEIDQIIKEISSNKNILQEEKKKLFQLYEENYQVYLKVIGELKSRIVDLEKDGLKITGIAKFNFPNFRKRILAISDGRKRSFASFKICDDDKDSLAEYTLADVMEDLKAMFSEIAERDTYALLGRFGKKEAVKTLLEDDFFDYWQIEYKSDTLRKMSSGKASFIILMLIIGLSKSKAPILIDQPEDNLDNRSITTDLVEYLKKKKLERQIILVTHNANIVVNSDAENIIVANQKGQGDIETSSPYQFDYTNGALENTFPLIEAEKDLLKSMGIREHIADIVEGGKEAFKKREEKYGF
jgi:hypothetical protein